MAHIFTTTRLPCAPSAPALHRRPVPIARCPARTAPHVGRTARPVRVVCSVAVASARRSYYETLGVPDNASIRDVKEAFRRLALEWHPDRNQLPGAKEKFMEFKEAYDTLSDFALRAKYDQQLRQSRGPAPGTPGFPWGNTRVTSPMRRAGSVRRTASNYATAPPAPAAQTVDRDRQFFEYQPPSGAAQPPPPPQPVAPPKPVDRDRMFFDYNPAATGVPQTAAGPANGTPVFTRTSASIFPSAAQQPPPAATASTYARSGTAARSTSPTRSTSRSRTVRRVANVPPVSQPYHQPYAQPVTRPVSQPVSQPVSRPAGPPAGYPPSVQQWPAASWPPPATHSSSAQAQATPPPKPATVIPTATAASATASTPTAAAPKPPQQTPVAPKETWSRGATAVWPPPGLGGEGFRIAVNQPAAPPAPQAQQASQPSPQPVRQPTHTQDASATTRPPSPASHAAATSTAMASAQAALARPQSQPRSKQPASTGVWAGTWDSLASLMDFKM